MNEKLTALTISDLKIALDYMKKFNKEFEDEILSGNGVPFENSEYQKRKILEANLESALMGKILDLMK